MCPFTSLLWLDWPGQGLSIAVAEVIANKLSILPLEPLKYHNKPPRGLRGGTTGRILSLLWISRRWDRWTSMTKSPHIRVEALCYLLRLPLLPLTWALSVWYADESMTHQQHTTTSPTSRPSSRAVQPDTEGAPPLSEKAVSSLLDFLAVVRGIVDQLRYQGFTCKDGRLFPPSGWRKRM